MLLPLLLLKPFFGAADTGAWPSVLKSTLLWSLLSNLAAWFLETRVVGRPSSLLLHAAASSAALMLVPLVSWRLHALLRALHQAHGAMRHMARVDGLTQLLNRHRFVEACQSDLVRAGRTGAPQALLLLDLDQFRNINDLHGHPAGDAVLCAVADQLRRTVRPSDPIGRWGGKQFIVGLHGYPAVEAVAMAERVRAQVAVLRFPMDVGPALHITASIGVAIWSDADQSFDTLVRRADDALRAAKQQGRNCVVGVVGNELTGDAAAPPLSVPLRAPGLVPVSGLDLILAASAAHHSAALDTDSDVRIDIESEIDSDPDGGFALTDPEVTAASASAQGASVVPAPRETRPSSHIA